MWILITSPFIDKLAANPEDAEVPAGKKMNVTADRGKDLIDLGLAEASDSDAPKPSKDEVEIPPIVAGEPGPVDGHEAAVESNHD